MKQPPLLDATSMAKHFIQDVVTKPRSPAKAGFLFNLKKSVIGSGGQTIGKNPLKNIIPCKAYSYAKLDIVVKLCYI